jgi:uncharacterized protein (AIM24 family)
MPTEATIEGGFAHVQDGMWLMGASQPVAYRGSLTERRVPGWIVPDRARLHNLEVVGKASCSDAKHPFLTRIDCAERLFVNSERILVAPTAARVGSQLLRVIPMSFKYALSVTEFKNPGWAVVATASRVNRFVLAEGEVLSVRLASVVAWTTKRPVGHCPKLTMRDLLIPRRQAKALWLNFYGPGVVWTEGAHGL